MFLFGALALSRTLSRAELRRRLKHSGEQIEALIDAARRGVGPTLTQPPDSPHADRLSS